MCKLPPASSSPKPGTVLIYMAVLLTALMVLFPPFVSLNGTEYASLLTGPEWSYQMGWLGEDFGLTYRLHWAALLVQLGALWTAALGAKWLLFPTGPRQHRSHLRRSMRRGECGPELSHDAFFHKGRRLPAAPRIPDSP